MRVARRIVLALMLATLVATVGAGVWLWQSGYRAYVVHTGSMSPTYRPGSLVIDGPAKGNYHPGEVITFRHSSYTTDVVTHRITDITNTGLIHTKGDANRTADVWDIRPSQVRGAVLGGIPLAGYVVVYLQHPLGVASVVTTFIALLLLWDLWFPAEEPGPFFVTAADPCTELDRESKRSRARRAAGATAAVAVAGK